MKKIVAGMFISLDGVVEAPDQWHFPYFNEEMGAAVGGMLDQADTMLHRPRDLRQLRRGMARPRGSRRRGRRVRQAARRMPARSSCRTRSWTSRGGIGAAPGRLRRGGHRAEAEPGGDIGMSGSPSIVRQLLEAGLLDELHLLVHPIAVRYGMQLFDEGERRSRSSCSRRRRSRPGAGAHLV